MHARLFLVVALAACGPSAAKVSDAPEGGDVDGGGGIDGPPQICAPGAATCDGDTLSVCRADGSGWDTLTCVAPAVCDAARRECYDACATAAQERSYVGCEYMPTVTSNVVWTGSFNFAVAVANLSPDQVATVNVTGGALGAPLSFDVPPSSVQVQILPWVSSLVSLSSGLVTDGAYTLVSSIPVIAYQFSPLEYTAGGMFSYTNDASLLFPTTAQETSFRVASFPAGSGFAPSIVAITATVDGTTVIVTPTANVDAGGGIGGMSTGVPTPVMLNRGDVVQLASTTGDLTGTLVEADQPIQVISGHACTFVPLDIGYCDHLEESMLPISALGTRYLVTAPAIPPAGAGKVEVIRVIATEANTTLTYDPPVPGAPTNIALAGGFIEISMNDDDFEIVADKKILVAQYMTGQDAGGNTGDPALAVAVPAEQYRSSYLFHAPVNYEYQYVNVTAPLGANITIDGAPVTLTAIGASGFGVARVSLGLGPAADGNHAAVGSEPFGISVYGYGQYTSYWYPGGMNLEEVIVE